jgi:alkanesulfonate monooxygenase SsuD/methylene tetrahydromethanopterin reductase-like flavin-dependent oxidoreductase (luciferase family)
MLGGMPGSLSIGCTLPTSGAAADPAAIGALAQTAEDLGFDSVWISDHVVVPEHISSAYPYSPDGRFPTLPTQAYLEPLATLGYLAGITRRVRLGIAVLILPYRHPLLTAKMIATLDNLSGGRVDLGIGVGWMREEFDALGLAPEVYQHRGSVTDEQLRILKSAWTEDVAGFEGRFYQFAPVGGRPPADLPPEEVAGCIASIRTQAERAGRDPAALRVCFDTTVDFQATDGRPFSGSIDTIAEQLRRYVEVGADSFLVGFGRLPPAEYERCLRRFAEQVRPALGPRIGA